jgi:hypothetical protein
MTAGFSYAIPERDGIESPLRSRFLIEHDLFGKPVPTFPDHALSDRGAFSKN